MFHSIQKHLDYENYCRERILLYLPFEDNENTLKHNLATWKNAYLLHKNTIRQNESKFIYNINSIWGDFENVVE
jgi:hypothetical protein